MKISISGSKSKTLIHLARSYMDSERFVECKLAEPCIEFYYMDELICTIHEWLSGIAITTPGDVGTTRLTTLFDHNLQPIQYIDIPSDPRALLGTTAAMATGYLIKYATRRRLTLGETRAIRKEKAKSRNVQTSPTHYVGDIIERSSPSESTGRINSPHERCAHFRRLKSGKTIRVKSCIIHPDRFEGSVPKTLTGV